jgi:murein DD-endopeptidase MepM/ murein hydrolase activator NlpD
MVLLSQCQRLLAQYPKHIAGALGALMLGSGATAFALASFAPDAADLPVRQVVEAVSTNPIISLAQQADALATQRFNLFRSEITRSNDTADTLLRRLGLDDAAAAAFLRSDAQARQSLIGRAGRSVTAEVSDDNRLTRLVARWATDDDKSFKRLVIEKGANKSLQSRIEDAPWSSSTRLAGGTIRSSLFAATDDARIPDSIAVQIAEIFSGDIDFHRALRRGDRFSVVYETLEADGEPLRPGRVLSAEFVNAGKQYQALWFQEPGSKGGYYTADGNSLRRAFLASPMEFSRVTSGFKMRLHPIFNQWRAHTGVDYAAPTGTPVRTVGDGLVAFAGWQNGYGNVVQVQHNASQSTLYAHLSKVLVHKGDRVSQGEKVALSGSTGWATGPHLHFEFRVNGVFHDPLTIARQSEAQPVSTAGRAVFERTALLARQQLSAASSLVQASAQ